MASFSSDFMKLISLLPKYEEIQNLLQQEREASYILREACEDMGRKLQQTVEQTPIETIEDTEECGYLIQSLVDRFWERIHTGHFSEVPMEIRKIYAIANYFKIFYFLLESCEITQIEKCSGFLDNAMLVGNTEHLYDRSSELKEKLTEFFDSIMEHNSNDELLVIEPQERNEYQCDITSLDCPSIMDFEKLCFQPKQPALLLNTFKHWPAIEKWRNLNYINKVAGNRSVPIEIGSNYTSDDWSQQVVKIRDFLRRQFHKDKDKISEVEYLAQHELFDQIPALKADLRVPDYCTLGTQTGEVDVKAWLGPKGTISPMHYDPKHNLLCQIFGLKQIILAAPEDTENLYPHPTEFLKNTSQIDAANLDFEKFPLAATVEFYNVFLQPGDCLYMPPKWWHYVKSESPSFSVSFWWE